MHYRVEGKATIPALAYDGVDPISFAPTGKSYPSSDLNFDWIASAEFDILGNQGIYEDLTHNFYINGKKFNLHHEKHYFRGVDADIEYLLSAPPLDIANPKPHIKFVLNQDQNMRGGGPYFIPEAIQAAFGHIANEQGGFYPTSDPDFAIRYNASVVPSDDESVVTLHFTDESTPGFVLVHRFDCETASPHRLMRYERGMPTQSFGSVSIRYVDDTTAMASIGAESFDAQSGKAVFRGKANFVDFGTSDSIGGFQARAMPSEGDWVQDWPTRRVYRFAAPSNWNLKRILLLTLSVVGFLIALYLFKRRSQFSHFSL